VVISPCIIVIVPVIIVEDRAVHEVYGHKTAAVVRIQSGIACVCKPVYKAVRKVYVHRVVVFITAVLNDPVFIRSAYYGTLAEIKAVHVSIGPDDCVVCCRGVCPLQRAIHESYVGVRIVVINRIPAPG
jgi:hypothetical protein